MLTRMLFAGLLLSVAAPVAAQDAPAQANGQPTAATSQKPERIICETQTQIGSRLASKRICMTASQWKEHQQQVHDQLDQLHQNVESQPGPG